MEGAKRIVSIWVCFPLFLVYLAVLVFAVGMSGATSQNVLTPRKLVVTYLNIIARKFQNHEEMLTLNLLGQILRLDKRESKLQKRRRSIQMFLLRMQHLQNKKHRENDFSPNALITKGFFKIKPSYRTQTQGNLFHEQVDGKAFLPQISTTQPPRLNSQNETAKHSEKYSKNPQYSLVSWNYFVN